MKFKTRYFVKSCLVLTMLTLYLYVFHYKKYGLENFQCPLNLIHKCAQIFKDKPYWKQIVSNGRSIYFYKAFFDSNIGRIKIVALVQKNSTYTNLRCRLNNSITSFASVEEASSPYDYENTERKSAYVSCDFKLNTNIYMSNLTLTLNDEESSEIIVGSSPKKVKLSDRRPLICVRPMFGPFDDINMLIEFIAFYTANGIRDFVFFDFMTSYRVLDFLSNVRTVNISVFRWNIEYIDDSIESNGQLAAQMFCLEEYRDYVLIYVDFDEYLVIQDTFFMSYNRPSLTLVNFIEQHKISNTAVIRIRNTFFCDKCFQSFRRGIKILSNFEQQQCIWKDQRTKMIILHPECIEFSQVHFISKFSDKCKDITPEVIADPKEILMHHYRNCYDVPTPTYCNSIRNLLEENNSMLKYSEQIKYHIYLLRKSDITY